MDLGPAQLPGPPLKERRNEKELTLATHIMDPRDKTQGTIPAPASPSSSSPSPDQDLGKPRTGLGSLHLGPFSFPLEGPHGGKDTEGPSARAPLTAQVISALPRAGQGWSQQPEPLSITSACQVRQ